VAVGVPALGHCNRALLFGAGKEPMVETTIVSEIVAIVAGLSGTIGAGSSIGPDTPLLSSGLIDSFAVAELAEALQQTYGVRIEVDDLGVDNADTALQLAELLGSRR
jgi:acyl carrier protein